jgi:tRNA 5-methylaminomethyl-2-thiouridine biosynthesis bifunctional protein
MLCGQIEGAAARRGRLERRVVVIGAGVAGASAAQALAQRGWQVMLVERNREVAAEASGNAQGVLYARLSAHRTLLSRLVLAGYQHTLRILRAGLPCDGDVWSDAPVLQLAFDEREAVRQRAVLGLGLPSTVLHEVNVEQASELAGIALDCAGLAFPAGGWVHPPALCRALLSHPGIELHSVQQATGLRAAQGEWSVLDGTRAIAHAPVVVVAAGAASTGFPDTAALPLRVNRGQVTLLPATVQSSRLHAVLCAEGYAVPARRRLHSVGATFGREADDALREVDQLENLAMLQRLSPALFRALGAPTADHNAISGRAGLRCVSPDYLPLVGPVDARVPGLLVSTAHGSRGLITAPLAGEVLAACLEDEPAPLPQDMMQSLQPRRFS